MIENWYKEAISSSRTAKIYLSKHTYVFYKGFRITFDKENNQYYIHDIRKTDFYTRIPEPDYNLLVEHGFIKGCNLIMSSRDEDRVNFHKQKLEKLYSARKEYIKEPLKNKKRLKVCNDNITYHIDQLFFYKSRLNQFQN